MLVSRSDGSKKISTGTSILELKAG